METSEQFKKSLKQNLSKTNKIQKICKVIKPKTKRGVRGKRKCVKEYKRSLRLLGVNAAGLKCKFTSFKKVVSELKPSVFFVQETKMKYEGQINLGDEYIVYELLRKNDRNGGISPSGISKSLAEYVQHPVCFINVQTSFMKISSFLFVRLWTMPRILYSSCGIPFPV